MYKKGLLAALMLFPWSVYANNLPDGFVYLKEVDPSIQQDMRYAGHHNFVGHPIKGYEVAECVLTEQAAILLSKIQLELKKSALSLKVYDCYRPQMAVDNFAEWSQEADAEIMKEEFYPHVNKADFFKLGYVAQKSSHTRGSTVDVTLVPLPIPEEGDYTPGQPLTACTNPVEKRFQDNSIDMGTGYDCMDVMSHSHSKMIGQRAINNRQLLKTIMEKYDFAAYPTEWWHFTLKDEPYPEIYFEFPIKSELPKPFSAKNETVQADEEF